MFGKRKDEKSKEISYGVGYIGNINKKPILEQEFVDENNFAFTYVQTGRTGTLRVYPYVVLTDYNSMFFLAYLTNGIKNLTHIKFKSGDERRTIFNKKTEYNINAQGYANFAINSNFDISVHKYEKGYLTREDIAFLKKVANDKKSVVEFHGDEISEFKLGEFERKAITKMIAELEKYEREGFLFSTAEY